MCIRNRHTRHASIESSRNFSRHDEREEQYRLSVLHWSSDPWFHCKHFTIRLSEGNRGLSCILKPSLWLEDLFCCLEKWNTAFANSWNLMTSSSVYGHQDQWRYGAPQNGGSEESVANKFDSTKKPGSIVPLNDELHLQCRTVTSWLPWYSKRADYNVDRS